MRRFSPSYHPHALFLKIHAHHATGEMGFIFHRIQLSDTPPPDLKKTGPFQQTQRFHVTIVSPVYYSRSMLKARPIQDSYFNTSAKHSADIEDTSTIFTASETATVLKHRTGFLLSFQTLQLLYTYLLFKLYVFFITYFHSSSLFFGLYPLKLPTMPVNKS